jgi:hypothetical protein
MPALLQGMRNLILHLGLVDFPRRQFFLHLAFVIGVIPSGIWGVKNDGNAHSV